MVKKGKPHKPFKSVSVRRAGQHQLDYVIKGHFNELQANFMEEFCLKNNLTVSAGLREVVNKYMALEKCGNEKKVPA